MKEAVVRLLESKRSGIEVDEGKKIPAISNFIESELLRWECSEIPKSVVAPQGTRRDEFFRESMNQGPRVFRRFDVSPSRAYVSYPSGQVKTLRSAGEFLFPQEYDISNTHMHPSRKPLVTMIEGVKRNERSKSA